VQSFLNVSYRQNFDVWEEVGKLLFFLVSVAYVFASDGII